MWIHVTDMKILLFNSQPKITGGTSMCFFITYITRHLALTERGYGYNYSGSIWLSQEPVASAISILNCAAYCFEHRFVNAENCPMLPKWSTCHLQEVFAHGQDAGRSMLHCEDQFEQSYMQSSSAHTKLKDYQEKGRQL